MLHACNLCASLLCLQSWLLLLQHHLGPVSLHDVAYQWQRNGGLYVHTLMKPHINSCIELRTLRFLVGPGISNTHVPNESSLLLRALKTLGPNRASLRASQPRAQPPARLPCNFGDFAGISSLAGGMFTRCKHCVTSKPQTTEGPGEWLRCQHPQQAD